MTKNKNTAAAVNVIDLGTDAAVSKPTKAKAKAKADDAALAVFGNVGDDARRRGLERAGHAVDGVAVEPVVAVVEVPLSSMAEAFDAHDADADADRLARVDEAHRKMREATKATSAHAFALIACEGDNDVRRFDAMRAKLAEWPEAIRAAACRLARSKTQPGGRTDEMLKRLHDEQPQGVTSGERRSSSPVVVNGTASFERVVMETANAGTYITNFRLGGVKKGQRVRITVDVIDG